MAICCVDFLQTVTAPDSNAGGANEVCMCVCMWVGTSQGDLYGPPERSVVFMNYFILFVFIFFGLFGRIFAVLGVGYSLYDGVLRERLGPSTLTCMPAQRVL